MKKSRRTIIVILSAGLALLLAFTFRVFLLENVVRPIALIFWLFWRVLQSIDQRVFWSVLLFAALMFAFIRLSAQALGEIPPPPVQHYNAILANIEILRNSIRMTSERGEEGLQVNLLKQNLVDMLVSLYTASQPDRPHWQVLEDLKAGRIPLPDSIHAFLFPPKVVLARPSLRQTLRRLWQAPARWADRRSGRAAAAYMHSLDEVLTYMETSLEIAHDK